MRGRAVTRAFSNFAAALAVVFVAGASYPALAKEKNSTEAGASTGVYNTRAIPKPSDRRPGELEGWDSQAPKGAKEKSAAAEKKTKTGKQEKAAPPQRSTDGGLPLPSSRGDPSDYAPVGFDKNGNFGTGFKF